MKFLSSFLYLPFICLTLANIVVGLKWSSSYPNGVMNYGSTLIVRWSYNLSENEIKEAENFALALIEREKKTFSQQWQVLAVQIPVTGKYRWVDQSPNIRPISGGGVGLVIKNVTEQAYTRYRCTFLSGFSASKKILIPVIKGITRSPWPTIHYSWQTPTPSTHSPLPAGTTRSPLSSTRYPSYTTTPYTTSPLPTGNVSVRLVGGRKPLEGRVEILHNSEWGTICDDGWDIRDARVVCRMLGNFTAVTAYSNAHFGRGSGRIWLDDVNCIGNEVSISRCHHRGWGIHNCFHSEDAGVVCQYNIGTTRSPLSSTRYPSYTTTPYTTSPLPTGNVSVRLVGGRKPLEGRVEILHNGEWGTICDDYWDIRDARVVCRMLGNFTAVTAYSNAHFGRGSGRIWLDDVNCIGNEVSISRCHHRGWGIHNCYHVEDAGVVCQYSMPSKIVSATSNVTVMRESKVNLTCTALGAPFPTVKWIRNSKTLATGLSSARYTINGIQLHQAGEYMCMASNAFGSSRKSTFVTVMQEPRSTVILFSVPHNAVSLGESVEITCKTDAYPPAKCEVFRRGNKLGESGYVISSIASDDFGPYNCSCSNRFGREQGTGTLTLYEKPSIQTLYPRFQDISETASFKIFCNASGNPQPNISWYLLTRSERAVEFGETLLVAKSSLDDEGTYTCKANNGRYEVTDNATVRIIYRVPRFLTMPENITANEDLGRNLNIHCNITGYPEPNVTWHRLGKLEAIGYGKTLTLLARWNNSGIYECVAENGIGKTARARSFFQILHKPYSTKLTTNRDNNVVIGNAPINIICTTIANPPAEQYDIYRDNKHVATSSSGLYVIAKAKAEDQGTYRCFPRNTIGSGANATVQLHVLGALSIVHSPRNKTVIEGQTLSLYCNASSSFYNIILPAIIRWNKEGQPRGSLSDGNLLSLKHVQPKDAGVYECVATNGIALPGVAKATVIVQYKPRATTYLSSGGTYITVNQKLVLVCKTDAVPPATSFIFYHEGVKIGESSNGVHNIPSVSSSGNGTYSCFPQNSIGFGDNATIVLKFQECGISYYGTGSHHQPQIVGGSYSVHGAWPWQVQIGVTIGGTTYPHNCGGSIINRLWIVTAAHCVTSSYGQIPYAPGALNVTLGQHYLDRVDSTEQNIPVQQVIVHRNYRRSTIDYDIALLKLQRPITFNKYVSPVCLPAFDFPNGATCFVSGWGRTGLYLPVSNVLQEAAIPLISRSTCNSIYSGRVTSRMRCAGTYRVNKGTCKGDSGGPLVCSKHGRWYLMGTTSWGRNGCADSGYPGVYVDMLYFNNWIKNFLQN